MTSWRDVVEAQDYGPPGDGYPMVAQSRLLIENDSPKAAWSPGRKLEDTVAQLQRDIEDCRKELRIAGGQGPVNPPRPTKWSGFTSTPVPRYSGKSSWEQYRQVFVAIACSIGWSPTAALKLFAHLDGDALNVALLMPVEEREQWTALARGISNYFNSPGRLAAVRRRFESASCRQGVDPATFATEPGILAVRGFENMGERACGLMVRNKFIAAQQCQALRRHLDGVSVEASIGDIVDSCRVWESHAQAGCDGQDRKFPHPSHHFPGGGENPTSFGVNDFGRVAGEHGTGIADACIVAPGVTCSSSDCELLMQWLMEVVRRGRLGIQEQPQGPDIGLGLRSSLRLSVIPGMDAPTLVPGLEGGMDPSSQVQLEPVLEVDPLVRGWDRECFSCGHQGHGVSRCSWMDREKGDGPGWRVSLPDHRRSWCD